MLMYQLKLAMKSLLRTPALSLLMIGAIALGITVAMTFVGLYHAISADPIPRKSSQLFYVGFDAWNPERPFNSEEPEMPPDQLTWMDAHGLLGSGIPTLETAMYKAVMVAHPAREDGLPERWEIRLARNDFFEMFDVPFRYGTAWSDDDDEAITPVVVLGEELNESLFGGENSVGRTVQLDDQQFTVVGVLDTWRPVPKFYDPLNGPFNDPEAAYLPFAWGNAKQLPTSGNSNGWGNSDGTWEGRIASEITWIQMWVQLDDDEQRDRYLSMVNAYAQEQKAAGRYQRPINNVLWDVQSWLKFQQVVPMENRTMMVIALLFLLICAVNLIGILLGKFLARAPEIGVRRALGASRSWVFVQHLIECEVIGVLGGALGIGMSALGLRFLARMFDVYVPAGLDLRTLGIGVGLALLAAMIAGIYPAWRICRIAPGMYLKIQ